MPYKNIARLIPTIQSASLVSHNLKKINTKKKMSSKDMIDLGFTNLVGISLIKATSDIID